MKHIFVIDDEVEIRHLIKKYLEKEGYGVTDFSNGHQVLQEIIRLKPDLLVLDINMPGTDGIELCKQIRKEHDLPIVFVSARGDEIDRIIGLEVGGDDYLTKPFSPRELVVRIKNIFRRIEKSSTVTGISEILSHNNLTIDYSGRVVTSNNIPISLTAKEFDTLYMLLKNRGIALSRSRILEEVWGYGMEVESRIIDDVVKRIRKKLGVATSDIIIETVWGFGYKIEKE